MQGSGDSNKYLQDLVLDHTVVAAKESKLECLKLLQVVVRNLADPLKNKEDKYRQLRISNEKVKTKLLPCPSAVDFLLALGFVKIKDGSDGETYLRLDSSFEVSTASMKEALEDVTRAMAILSDSGTLTNGSVSNTGTLRLGGSLNDNSLTPEGILIKANNSNTVPSSRISEKQRARMLMEQKRQKELEDAKEARARTSALIKTDKYVRENDENWKSCQSAACVKSGDGISTFRDKYGEN